MNGVDAATLPDAVGPDVIASTDRLPALIDRARGKLAEARTAAEALEAKHVAEAALHYAKITGAANEAHVDCLRIVTLAEIRIALEYRAAQERGEVASRKDGAAIRDHVQTADKVAPPTLKDLGLDRRRLSEFDSLAQAGEVAVEQAISDAATEAGSHGRTVTKSAVRKRLRRRTASDSRSDPAPTGRAEGKSKRQESASVIPPRPDHLNHLAILIRNMAGVIPKFMGGREARSLADHHGIEFEREQLCDIVNFLTDIGAAPSVVSAAPPPAALVEGILGQLHIHMLEHQDTDEQVILAALDEAGCLVRTGALAQMGGPA